MTNASRGAPYSGNPQSSRLWRLLLLLLLQSEITSMWLLNCRNVRASAVTSGGRGDYATPQYRILIRFTACGSPHLSNALLLLTIIILALFSRVAFVPGGLWQQSQLAPKS